MPPYQHPLPDNPAPVHGLTLALHPRQLTPVTHPNFFRPGAAIRHVTEPVPL